MIEKKKQLVKLGKALACIGIERESARRDLETLTKQGGILYIVGNAASRAAFSGSRGKVEGDGRGISRISA